MREEIELEVMEQAIKSVSDSSPGILDVPSESTQLIWVLESSKEFQKMMESASAALQKSPGLSSVAVMRAMVGSGILVGMRYSRFCSGAELLARTKKIAEKQRAGQKISRGKILRSVTPRSARKKASGSGAFLRTSILDARGNVKAIPISKKCPVCSGAIKNNKCVECGASWPNMEYRKP